MGTSSSDDIFSVLARPDDRDWPEGLGTQDVYQLACAEFSEDDINPLVGLLRSPDHVVRSRGLFVFGRLGKKALGAIDDALLNVSHPMVAARSSLLDGILCFIDALSVAQVARLLILADDENDLVRFKAVAVLSSIPFRKLVDAVGSMATTTAIDEHRAGLAILASTDSAENLFQEALAARRILSTYLFAKVTLDSRLGRLKQPLSYDGRSEIGKLVSANVDRWVARNAR